MQPQHPTLNDFEHEPCSPAALHASESYALRNEATAQALNAVITWYYWRL